MPSETDSASHEIGFIFNFTQALYRLQAAARDNSPIMVSGEEAKALIEALRILRKGPAMGMSEADVVWSGGKPSAPASPRPHATPRPAPSSKPGTTPSPKSAPPQKGSPSKGGKGGGY